MFGTKLCWFEFSVSSLRREQSWSFDPCVTSAACRSRTFVCSWDLVIPNMSPRPPPPVPLPGVYVHDFCCPVMPPCLCQDLLVAAHDSPCTPALSCRAFVSAVWTLDVALPFSKRAASSPRGLRRNALIRSQYGVCVCVSVSFLIHVTSLLRLGGQWGSLWCPRPRRMTHISIASRQTTGVTQS